jgi:hypothetical protein
MMDDSIYHDQIKAMQGGGGRVLEDDEYDKL